MFIDSDDMFLYDIFDKVYKVAKEGNYDIVQFPYIMQAKDLLHVYINLNGNDTPIYQPNLSYYMFYYKGQLKQNDRYIWAKLIKRDVLNTALKSIDKFYLNQHMTLCEDGLLNFMVLKKAKSLIFINEYGLYYENNYGGFSKLGIKQYQKIKKAIHDYMLFLKFLFEYTANNQYEKAMADYKMKFFFFYYKKIFNDKTIENTKLFNQVYNLYVNSAFISKITKEILISLKRNITKSIK